MCYKPQSTWKTIGIMSGTSLDGLDMAYCEFTEENGKWSFQIIRAQTYDYDAQWKKKLSELPGKNALTLAQTHVELGHFIGKTVKEFITSYTLKPDFIACHGHTIFHQPDKGFTLQIGEGASIAAETGIAVVCDFRSLDVALGGQGAPLVPIGDKLLFPDYDCCINLGGFANISYNAFYKRIAFDICPVNIVINHLSELLGKKFDENGELARTGKLHLELFQALNQLAFYKTPPPKSLGKEWVEKNVFPLLQQYSLPIPDLIRTVTEHAAYQISVVINSISGNTSEHTTLVTGGGAKNIFLTKLLRKYCNSHLYIPNNLIIDYKEALIFAFLGILRMQKKANCLQSVTGARIDNTGGCVYEP
ncbi:MAG: anhydro-N-acetylmuramic acid kinase [Lentimicrobiaceae bacterium]|nr:anhydro-N-acetylmuramic acid kinase [Lentimicrobiaceae bacterium]